jgi:hypothetical protein
VQTLFAQSGGDSSKPDGWGFVTFDSGVNHKLAAAMPAGVRFIDPLERMCHLPSCPYREESTFMMWDEGPLLSLWQQAGRRQLLPYFEGN